MLRLLLVVFHLWLVFLVWFGQRLRLGPVEGGILVSTLVLGLLVGSEVLFTVFFEVRAKRAASTAVSHRWLRGRIPVILGVLFRLAILISVYMVAVEYPARVNLLEDVGPFKRPFLFLLWWKLWAELSLTPLLTALGIALLWVPVEWLVIRRRLARGLIFMVLPVLLLSGLVHLRYRIVIEPDPARIEQQEGVSILFRSDSVTDPEHRQVWTHPRRIYVEESSRVAYLSFGQTLGSNICDRSNLWRVDLVTGDYRTLITDQNRSLTMNPTNEYLYAYPFHDPLLLKIHKDTFELAAAIPTPTNLVPVAASLVVGILDMEPDIYFTQNMYPAIFVYNQALDRFTGAVDLVEPGLARLGDYCCVLRHRPETDDLYVMTGSFLEPMMLRFDRGSLELKDKHRIPEMSNDFVMQRGQEPALYMVSELAGEIYRMDPDSLEWSFFNEGVPGAAIEFDEYLDRLLILEPSGGILIVVGPDGVMERQYEVGPRAVDLSVTEAGIYVLAEMGLVFVSH